MRGQAPQTPVKVAYVMAVVIATISGGAAFFHAVEGWSWVDSFYFATATLTTVGYGDVVPTHDASKLFAIPFMLFGIGIMLYSFRIMGDHVVEKRLKALQHSRMTYGLEEDVDDANPLPQRNQRSAPRKGR
ncbi:two pore domain potassium channel family protein [Candidatus Micrarchaeota archaeon]|nr:two pore domain potassium channel family protein [Candidatus Micrarchaeota archaeon]